MQGVRYYSDAWRRCGIFFQRGVIAQPNGFSRWLKKFFKVKSEIKSEQVWSCWRRMLCGWFFKEWMYAFSITHIYWLIFLRVRSAPKTFSNTKFSNFISVERKLRSSLKSHHQWKKFGQQKYLLTDDNMLLIILNGL